VALASSNGDRLLATRSGDYCPEAGFLVCFDFNPTLGHEQNGAISGIVLVDQVRSLLRKTIHQKAGVAPVKFLDEVRERLAVLLQID
jgi:mRNA-degrading endonuclease toxin of MazEF toxin-antitoxin module